MEDLYFCVAEKTCGAGFLRQLADGNDNKNSLLFAIGNKGREENLWNGALKKLTSGVERKRNAVVVFSGMEKIFSPT
jgi:hypothetical protein